MLSRRKQRAAASLNFTSAHIRAKQQGGLAPLTVHRPVRKSTPPVPAKPNSTGSELCDALMERFGNSIFLIGEAERQKARFTDLYHESFGFEIQRPLSVSLRVAVTDYYVNQCYAVRSIGTFMYIEKNQRTIWYIEVRETKLSARINLRVV